MRIYVGNLSFEVTGQDLETAFGVHGKVASTDVIMDRETGRPKGFAFVEMPNAPEAAVAIAALNGKAIKGRVVTVNEARPRDAGGQTMRGGGAPRRL